MKWRGTLLVMAIMTGKGAAEQPVQDPIADMIAECPKPDGDAIVVCGHNHRREAARYRLPIRQDGFDVDGPVDSVARERHRMYEVGESGTGSCSTSGAGGWTGCMIQDWRHSKQQHGR